MWMGAGVWQGVGTQRAHNNNNNNNNNNNHTTDRQTFSQHVDAVCCFHSQCTQSQALSDSSQRYSLISDLFLAQ